VNASSLDEVRFTDERRGRFVRAHLAVLFAVTCVTAWFSYGYFHPDEYFQTLQYARSKLGDVPTFFLPWEYAQQMRPWMLPGAYWVVGRVLRALGSSDVFVFAFACRLLTGLANVFALARFLRTTLPWAKSDEEKRLHVRVVTLSGFLPYLFVRTSSESASMAALTLGFALLLEDSAPADDGRTWSVPKASRAWRGLLAGFLFGIAFECRFQTAFFVVGVLAWLVVVGKGTRRPLARIVVGGVVAVGFGALVDRWGYGNWTFPAWTYFQANILEGAAGVFGSDPPMAYFWMLPANFFMPVVLALLALALVAWFRCPRHPITWATLPFFLLHNLISHKEERFLFPIATMATAFVVMALGPSFGPAPFRPDVVERIARAGWSNRWSWPARLLALASTIVMVLLAFTAPGWNHNVRFSRFLHDRFGDEFHATVSPEITLSGPAFHPRVYDVDKADPTEMMRRIEAGTARDWFVTDDPIMRTGTKLDAHAELVFSELPFFRIPWLAAHEMALVDAYNTHALPRMRRLHYRSLYRIW
jgi:phosphatidylinositol glycan class B